MKSREFSLPDVQIPRNVPTSMYNFMEFFKGFENLPVVRSIFGDDTGKVLQELKLEGFHFKGAYNATYEKDGHLLMNAHFLREGEQLALYLDVICELVHVRQVKEGKPLFDDRYEYTDRPSELEAYKLAVNEARRLSMSEKEVFEYLRADQMSEDEVRKLAKNLNIKVATKPAQKRKR